jgi:hypothetical protein
MVVRKAVKKKVEKKRVLKKKPVKKVVSKHKVVKSVKKNVNEECVSSKDKKVYKWVNFIFRSEYLESNVEAAYKLGGKAVLVVDYRKNPDEIDNLLYGYKCYSGVKETDNLELEKYEYVCKRYNNTDGTINIVVLFEFSKKTLDGRDKRYVESLKGLASLNNPMDPLADYSSNINENTGKGSFDLIDKGIQELDKIIESCPKESLPTLALLINESNKEEWESSKKEYLATKIDNSEIDYLGEHTVFKKIANKFLDKNQKEIADLMEMSRFRYLLYWVEEILETVNDKGFYARGMVQVDGYNSFEKI